MKSFVERHRYEVLGATEHQVVIRTESGTARTGKITLYTFDGPDEMWIAVQSMSDAPVREYFRRVPVHRPR